MAAPMAQLQLQLKLRYSPLHHPPLGSINTTPPFPHHHTAFPSFSPFKMLPMPMPMPRGSQLSYSYAGGSGGGGVGRSSGGGGGGGDGDNNSHNSKSFWDSFGPIGAFLSGWRSRVAADPQFPFKVVMEELVGVTACVVGDMASRPNFGLNELDFVFSTLVVGSILNFVLMYLLAPTAFSASTTHSLPSIFANSPTSHMFEPGPYALLDRFGTFVYKGTLFAAVGFAAGLVGTALSNALINTRKAMDPNFETPNKPPPTFLNAITWALHMGISSNFRYQTLNGVEYLLAKGLPPFIFKSSVIVLRCLNNVLGGISFVILARLTGSQSVDKPKLLLAQDRSSSSSSSSSSSIIAKDKLLNEAASADDDLQSNHSSSSK